MFTLLVWAPHFKNHCPYQMMPPITHQLHDHPVTDVMKQGVQSMSAGSLPPGTQNRSRETCYHK